MPLKRCFELGSKSFTDNDDFKMRFGVGGSKQQKVVSKQGGENNGS